MSHGTILKRESAPCFDAGSKYCPCELALLGQCVACSQLRGKNVCACGWSGVCVSLQFAFNGSRPAPGRVPSTVSILEQRVMDDTPDDVRVLILTLDVPQDVATWSVFPGSFVMLRPQGRSERWNVPLCVTRAQDSSLEVMMEVLGPKTIALDTAASSGSNLILTGPFWSGIQGIENLRKFGGGRVLAVAKGIGQATLLQAAEYVAHRGGFLRAMIGPGPLGSVFSAGLLTSLGASVEVMPKAKDHNLRRIAGELSAGGYDLLLSSGSDTQHQNLKSLLGEMPEPPAFAWSSNLTMTCAEGICGSCLVQGFRGCKAHIPENALWNK
ncbi:MAG TPA: hypothetical protein GXX23_03730 [Firmicutes bacterium]|nr:hypothetical protein [Candidatus Fermentithermobacillaceae bacterium]